MKVIFTPSEITHSRPPSGKSDARPPDHWNEERTLVACLIVGNLIFWGSLFYLLAY
jgi:hypothetical protein